MNRNVKTLGKESARLLASLAESNRHVFTVGEAISTLGLRPAAVRRLLHRLLIRKWLKRIARGTYALIPLETGLGDDYAPNEYVIASELVQPYYVSYWTALNYHNMTEQVPSKVYIATTKRKMPISLPDVTFTFVRLKPDKFFGFSQVWVQSHRVNMAEPEKAVVDCLDQPRYCGGIREIAKAVGSKNPNVDWDRLVDYAFRMGNGAVLKRLGFLMETFRIRPDLHHRIRKRLSKGYALLDPAGDRKGRYDSFWHVIVNVPEHELTGWRRS